MSISLCDAVVLFPEPVQLLAHCVILADLLVDDEQCGVDGQHCAEHDRGEFNAHRLPPCGTTGVLAKGNCLGRGEIPSSRCHRAVQASAGTVSAQASTRARMESSL